MSLDKAVQTLPVLSTLPLTGKQQLTLLILAETCLMCDELSLKSPQPKSDRLQLSEVLEKMFVWHAGRDKGREDRDQWNNTF